MKDVHRQVDADGDHDQNELDDRERPDRVAAPRRRQRARPSEVVVAPEPGSVALFEPGEEHDEHEDRAAAQDERRPRDL